MNFLPYSNQNNKEIKLYGVTGFCECDSAVGRLCSKKENYDAEREDIICIFEPSSACELISRISPAGVVVFASAMSAKLLCVLLCAKIPYLVLKDSSYPIYLHEGKICILDTEKNILIINPSIETLNKYPRKLSQAVLQREGDVIQTMKSKNGQGLLINSQMTYDSLVMLAEENCALPITVELPCAKIGAEEDFLDFAETVFCAALYGNLSLMLCGAKKEKDICFSQKLLWRVFCELEAQGREFNGYIKKGILTDAPSYFLLPHIHRPPDFICIDLDSFLENMFSCELDCIIFDEYTKKNFEKIWHTLIKENPPPCPIYLKSVRAASSPLLEYFGEITKADNIYIPSRQSDKNP